jgi:hypothetical protein
MCPILDDTFKFYDKRYIEVLFKLYLQQKVQLNWIYNHYIWPLFQLCAFVHSTYCDKHVYMHFKTWLKQLVV